MKFTVEYEKEEYTSLVDMVNKMTDVVGKAIQYAHLERIERIKNQRLKTVGSMFDSILIHRRNPTPSPHPREF